MDAHSIFLQDFFEKFTCKNSFCKLLFATQPAYVSQFLPTFSLIFPMKNM